MSVEGLGEWDDEPDFDDAPAAPVAPGGDEPQLYYATVDEFVAKSLIPTYRRDVGGHSSAWCPEWWRHPEAVARLEALWRAWEHLRLDPATGSSVWFRDHADHHMGVLLSGDGPFKGCSPEKGHGERQKPLPIVAPPPGLFTRA